MNHETFLFDLMLIIFKQLKRKGYDEINIDNSIQWLENKINTNAKKIIAKRIIGARTLSNRKEYLVQTKNHKEPFWVDSRLIINCKKLLEKFKNTLK
jgi:hypothetical protein